MAVKLVQERGVAVRQAATGRGLHDKVLCKRVWNVAAHHREQAFPGQAGSRMRTDIEVFG